MAGRLAKAATIAAALTCSLALTACDAFAAWEENADQDGQRWTAPADVAPPELSWTDCQDGVQCTTMTVPVDWQEPDGPDTKVNVVRLPASAPERRAGSVVLHFGAGHGTSNVLGQLPASIESLTKRFDVVVFDTRGLGKEDNGTLIECAEPPASVYGLVPELSEQSWQDQIDQNTAYNDSCRKAAGEAFDGLTSWQVAHDLEALRAGLGEEKLRYIGNSYGTVFGQAYAELFPEQIGQMYLDGVADHTQPDLEKWLGNYARTHENQLARFDEWCAESENCTLRGDEIGEVWQELMAEAEQSPLPAPGAGEGKTVSLGQLYVGALRGMSLPPTWPLLAQALEQARSGDAGAFLTDPLAEPSPEQVNGIQQSLQCREFVPNQPSYGEFEQMEERLREIAPRFGWLSARMEVGRCLGIPDDPAYPPHPLQAEDAPPVLVGIGETDNNTPNLGGQHVAEQLPGARELWHGDGHAAYLHGNSCLGERVETYLLDGTLPPAGTTCEAELLP
ncbi:alpha/beta hydrolase family protein [Tamaricihabitans halophyticus]|uniref:Alpha/beta hydrolase family protein n=1 Tax=Tamaricihabitans halophyticus TaxID=1262583 RepID=A0A4R2R344_9PSEU|nr:alpha/beta hydrolase [Tamaricihabitans halophyticus]TCP57212.1 alpha/beta hydrolase family protein [Tamaricihabitans halophyticus]